MKHHFYFLLSAILFFINVNAQCINYGTIVISEVHFDTYFAEDLSAPFHSYGEYIELYNSSNVAVNLENWEIRDNHTKFKFVVDADNGPEKFMIAAGGYKIITYDGTHETNGGIFPGRDKFMELFPAAAGYYDDIILQTKMVLYNDTDKISLYNDKHKLIDQVSYLNSNAQFSPDPRTYMHIPLVPYTIDIIPRLNNGSGGVINGAIYTNSTNAIYRKDQLNYFVGGGISFDVAPATPLSIPFAATIVLADLDPFIFGGNPPVVVPIFNETESITYDILNPIQITGRTKSFYDELGRPLVSLSKDYVNDHVWGTETVYDAFGRKFRESFPAPTCSEFDKVDFLSNPIYKAVLLDKYYSDNNTLEPYQAIATQPFSEIKYDELNPGNVINVFGGNPVGGVFKTGYNFTVPAAQEMYYAYGYNFYDGPTNNNQELIITQFNKTIAVDANGVENVQFTDGEGKLLATARSGGTITYPVYSLIGRQGFVDIYIPYGITAAPVFLGGNSNYSVFDLKTGQPESINNMTGGHAYRIVSSTVPTADPKMYVTNVATGGTLVPESGALGVQYEVNYYDYSINIYNKTGQLVKSVQPNAFELAFHGSPIVIKDSPAYMLSGATSFVSNHSYNDLGQLKETINSDTGTSNFAYRKDGQVRYSQNALQAIPDALQQRKVSYTNYDSYARPVESGVITSASTSLWADALAAVDNIALISGSTSEQVFTIYDNADIITLPLDLQLDPYIDTWVPSLQNYIQKNLSGNVAISYAKEGSKYTSISWYSYDLYGRVDWVAQYNDAFGIKTIHYEYDYKGNVTQVIYQKDDPADNFIHQYIYDDNNVITKVLTATAGNSFTTQAEYGYYASGELKRTYLNEAQQGLDYVYTLGGMLKSINHPDLSQAHDPGHDDNDVFGLSLDYYNGDYQRPSKPEITTSSSIVPNYNGNITGARWANRQDVHPNPALPISTTGVLNTASQQAYVYEYERNNWLQKSTYGDTDNTAVVTTNAKYKESGLTYDANGNILTLQRTDQNSALTDDLTYNYTATGKNSLTQIDDAVTTPNPTDIEDNNYDYDVLGQLTHTTEGDLHYYYNAQGLVTQIWDTDMPVVKFYYNERGNRMRKEKYNPNTGALISSTFYVYDLSGNIVSIYQKTASGAMLEQTEVPIYGISRIGVYFTASQQNAFSNSTCYEITDHLGNIRYVVQKPNGQSPVTFSYADYYSFGEPLPDRITSQGYRFAFQGMELDPETGMEAFSLRLWDGRIGRWLTTDPANQFDSPYLGMGNNGVGMIDPDGGYVGEYFLMRGIGRNLWSGAKGTFNFFTHDLYQANTWKGFGNLIAASAVYTWNPYMSAPNMMAFDAKYGTNTLNTSLGISDALNAYGAKWASGDSEQIGEAIGSLLWAGVEAFAGSKGMGALAKTKTAATVVKTIETLNVPKGIQSTALVLEYPAVAEVAGTAKQTFLMPGEIIDRFGSLEGKWLSKPGVPYEARSITAGLNPYTQFKVLKPFAVQESLAAPGMLNRQYGFGIQFESNISVDVLIKRKIIEPF